jgi:hypothetical protein
MVGIPGHFNTAARRVSFLALRGFKSMQLAVRPAQQPRAPAPAATAGASSSGRAAAAAAAAARGKGACARIRQARVHRRNACSEP